MGLRGSIAITCCLAAVAVAASGCGPELTAAPVHFASVGPEESQAVAYYPKGDETESVLILRKVGPARIQAGQEFQYRIEAYNPTDQVVLMNLLITDEVDPAIELTSSSPQWRDIDEAEEARELVPDPQEGDEDLDDFPMAPPAMTTLEGQTDGAPGGPRAIAQWFIKELYPEKLVTINVRARATGQTEGWIKGCAIARYDIAACIQSQVVSPELTLTLSAPEGGIVCANERRTVNVIVANRGTGAARNVAVNLSMSEGLRPVDGGRSLRRQIGTLRAGESQDFSLPISLAGSGDYRIQATATAEGGLSAEDEAQFQARQSILAVAARGPEVEHVGVPAEYKIEASNTGDAPARNLEIENVVPSGMEFLDASHGGRLEGGKVVWRFDSLPPNHRYVVTVRFRGLEDTDQRMLRSVATARAVCTGDITDVVQTRLEGVPAIVVEVVDTQDPNKVGEDEIYEIKVTNQGSAEETNVAVTCYLEEAQEFRSATGTTRVTAEPGARKITFQPVPRLAPKQTAQWRVRVRCLQPGDVRFGTEVRSDQHTRPVEETEATEVYR